MGQPLIRSANPFNLKKTRLLFSFCRRLHQNFSPPNPSTIDASFLTSIILFTFINSDQHRRPLSPSSLIAREQSPIKANNSSTQQTSKNTSDSDDYSCFSTKLKSIFLEKLFILLKLGDVYGHPKAASLRTIPMRFPDLCAHLFDGNSVTDDDGDDTSHHASEPFQESPPSASSPSASSPYTASPSAFEMKKALQSLTKGYTIPQCLEKLEVPELGPTNPLCFVAYHIIRGTMNMREMWMHFPDVPEILQEWLEMTGTSLGVLKDGKIVV
ncbi:unnamed protein product [Lactuca saligna]|uniref:Uncharacterized protein n=1 Tax=Lactuca saligna TaxID=75948 RepID=A0AA36DZA5_LACSI|nr:unnamed protein product [Lactuca saligna]